VAEEASQSDVDSLIGRAVLEGNTWVVTRDTFCRDAFVSGLGEC